MHLLYRKNRYKSRFTYEDSDSSSLGDENDYSTSDDLEDSDDDNEVEVGTCGSREQENENNSKRLKKNVQMKGKIGKPGDSRNVKRKVKRGKRVNWAGRDADMDETSVEDIYYRHFGNKLHIEGGCLIYDYGGKRVIYEEDDDHSDDVELDVEIIERGKTEIDHSDDVELSSDVKIIERSNMEYVELSSDVESIERSNMEIGPSKSPQYNASSVDGGNEEWIPNPMNFMENLMEQLKRPYDQEEYNDLWERVNQKIPGSGDKRTWEGNTKDGFGKSYLEIYKDLEARLLAVQSEQPKRLNILRGFFYWLLNERRIRAFRPWEDPVCLAVMPGSK